MGMVRTGHEASDWQLPQHFRVPFALSGRWQSGASQVGRSWISCGCLSFSNVTCWQILLQKSKIGWPQKCREGRFLAISSAEGSLGSIRRSVVVFARNDVVPHVAAWGTHQSSEEIRSSVE